MTEATLQNIKRESSHKNYVAPVDDFALGKECHRLGFIPSKDWTPRQLAGWEFAGQRAYRTAMWEAGE